MNRAADILKFFLKFFVPHGFFRVRDYVRSRVEKTQRRKRLALVRSGRSGLKEFDYEDAVRFLRGIGCDEIQVREGSIPERSLEFICEAVEKLVSPERFLVGLHVGNFVGLSLAYITRFVVGLHPEAIMISVDPNVVHRGIDNPLGKTLALLDRYGLTKHSMILCGYSLEKNISNDASMYTEYDPVVHYSSEHACENQLLLLKRLLGKNVAFAVLDGNHEPQYLRRELAMIHGLLMDGGLVFLDDVTWWWDEIRTVFDNVESNRFEKIGYDKRVGVLMKKEVAS